MALNTDSARQVARAGTVVVRRGMGPLGWLTVIFVLCKIFKVGAIANWSWWLVLLPLYGPMVAVLGIMLLFGLVCGLVFLGAVALDWFEGRRYRKRSFAKRPYR